MSSSGEKRSSLKRGLTKRADKVRNLLKRMSGGSGDRRNNVESSLSSAGPKASSTSNLGYYRTSLDESEQHKSRMRTVSSGAARLSAEGPANNPRLRHHGVFANKQSSTLAGPSPPTSPTVSYHSNRTSTTSNSTYSLGPRSNATSMDDLAIGSNSLASLPSFSTSSSLSSREYRSCEEPEDFKESPTKRDGTVRVIHPGQEATTLKVKPLKDKEENERSKKEQHNHHHHHQPLSSLANVVLGTDDEPKRFLSLKDKQEVVLPSIEEKLEHLEHVEGGTKIREGLASVEIKLQEKVLHTTDIAVDDTAKEKQSQNVDLPSKEQQQKQGSPTSQEEDCLLPPPAAENKFAAKDTRRLHENKEEISNVPQSSPEHQQLSLSSIDKTVKEAQEQNTPPIELTYPTPFPVVDAHTIEPTTSAVDERMLPSIRKDNQEPPSSSTKKDEQMLSVVSKNNEAAQLLTNKSDPVYPQEISAESSDVATVPDRQGSESSSSEGYSQEDPNGSPFDEHGSELPTTNMKESDDEASKPATEEEEEEEEEADVTTNSEERQLVLRTPPLYEAMSKRVAYFDKGQRGKITVLDTYTSLRGLGYYWIVAIPATFIMHLRLSPLTAPSYAGVKDLLCLPIYTNRVAQALQAPEGPLVAQRELMPTWIKLYGRHHRTEGVCGLGFWGGFRAVRAAERTSQVQWWDIRLW
ncbi:hypothetical protein BX666DRAFT_1918393 [Dichotomocladium elegans]|nr:hypothetical protein BX666DRAFT_1918393 [Dichotomocladium elegans]